jgi:predicted PurR-regulated permease PerM
VTLKAVKPPPDEPQSAIEDPQPSVRVRNVALTILTVLASILVLQYAQAMIIPIVLGVLISYALEPFVAALARCHVPRPLAAAIVLVGISVSGGWLLYNLRTQVSAIVQQLPDGARRLRRLVESDRPTTATAIQQVQRAATELERAATAAAPPPPSSGVQRVQVQAAPINIGDYVMWGSLGIAAAVGQLVLILFLAFFLLSSGDMYRRKMVKIAGPSLTKKKVTLEILREIDRQIEAFLMVQLFTSTVVAIVTWAAFRALGVEQAAILGLFAGLFNSIPYFGPVIVTGGTAVIAFLQFGSINMALVVAGVSLLITSLEGFLLTPWLSGRAARMNAVAIFVGLLFWGWVWGVWGMLLAVPMLMVIKAVCDHVEDLERVGELLGELYGEFEVALHLARGELFDPRATAHPSTGSG